MNNQERKETDAVELIDIMSIIKDYFRVFRKMWKQIIALIVLCTVGITLLANHRYVPYYTASATYSINIGADVQNGSSMNKAFFDNSAAEQMATTFPYILTSGVLQRKVAKEMEVPAISGSLSAKVTPNTNFLTIAVTDVDADRAYNTLQAVVNNYPSVSEVIIGKIDMEMLDETGVPKKPDNEKDLKRDAVKGALIGIILGLAWVLAVGVFRRTIRREEDCAKRFNSRCLCTVPRIMKKKKSKEDIEKLNILEDNISPEFVEAFQILANKVVYGIEKNNVRSILITSALAGEGKSTIAVNLALSLAQEGKRVALIDGDLRNPSDAKILGSENKKGLVDYLKGKAKLADCMVSAKDLFQAKIPFIFISGGEPVANGAELLENARMRRLLEELENQADYVIFDTAPVGLLTDASVLAEFADGALFVIKRDYAKSDYILEGMEQLKDDNIPIMGCVLNDEQ